MDNHNYVDSRLLVYIVHLILLKCINWIKRRESNNLRYLGRILVSIYIIIIHSFLSIDSFSFCTIEFSIIIVIKIL